MIDPLFAALLRTDAFYGNHDFTKFSMKKINDEYLLFSESIATKYPGYIMDKKYRIQNKDDVEVDLNRFKDLLLSKNIDDYFSNKDKYFGKQTRFLNREPIHNITYASYPRSGNSFLRKYFENITGLATGSDMVLKFNLNVTL